MQTVVHTAAVSINTKVERFKWLYPLGFFAFAFINTLFTQWIIFFHAPADAHNLPGGAGLFGTVLLSGFVLQALLNPLIGAVSDRTRHRWGRRRPFILIGAPLLGVVFYGLWFAKSMPLAVLSILLYCSLFVSVVQPYSALLPTLAPSKSVRVKYSLSGALLAVCAAGLALVGGPLIIERTSFQSLGVLGICVLLCFVFFPMLLVKEEGNDHPVNGLSELNESSTKNRPANGFTTHQAGQADHALHFRSIGNHIGDLLKQRNVFLFILGNGAATAFITTLSLSTPYLNEALLGRPREYAGILNGFLFAGMILSAALFAVFWRRIHFIRLFTFCMAMGGGVSLLIGGVSFFTSLQHRLFIWWMTFGVVGMVLLISLVSPPLILSRFIDMDGGSREGLFFGMNGMAVNLSNALAYQISALLLDFGHTKFSPMGVILVLCFAGCLAILATTFLAMAANADKKMRHKDDRYLIDEISGNNMQPIFIIGLHRSGTTFLYETLNKVFPVASLTVYHIVHYHQIMQQHQQRTAGAAKAELDAQFQKWGMDTRKTDNIALSHATMEEYGWLLRRHSSALFTNEKTAPLLEEICKKLLATTPSAQAVLLKNPWDTGHVADILRQFPKARFIFLQRDPVAILNSQFRNAVHFGAKKDLFLNLLLEGFTLGKIVMFFQRSLRTLAGARFYNRVMLRHLLKDVTRELGRLESSWKAAPHNQRLLVNYDQLVRDPLSNLERIADFLALDPTSDLQSIKANPRDPKYLPDIAAVQAAFRQSLKEKGIAQKPLDEMVER